jgi:hypothetical protein
MWPSVNAKIGRIEKVKALCLTAFGLVHTINPRTF